MKVLLIGHACGPGLGSEPGNTWNWAQSLSRIHRVWVIAHPERRGSVESYLQEHPNGHLRFVWVTVNRCFDPWRPARGERWIRIHYLLWLSEAYKKALEVCRQEDIDVVHHVSLATVSAAPALWRLPVRSVWGPIGGAQTTDARYLHLFGRQQWAERMRTARVRALKFSRSLKNAVKECDAIFACNRETSDLLERLGRCRVEMLLDCGLPQTYVPEHLPAFVRASSDFNVLWAGRLIPLKGLWLALQAISRVNDPRLKLIVAGGGPQREEMESLTQKLALEKRVTFLGEVPHHAMSSIFQTASAFLFTSLRDTSGAVVLEAMAHGLPVITFDRQCIDAFLPDEASVKVKLSEPDETISGIASAMGNLANAPRAVEQMRVAAWNFARQQTWDRRAAQMTKIYLNLVNTGGKVSPVLQFDN